MVFLGLRCPGGCVVPPLPSANNEQRSIHTNLWCQRHKSKRLFPPCLIIIPSILMNASLKPFLSRLLSMQKRRLSCPVIFPFFLLLYSHLLYRRREKACGDIQQWRHCNAAFPCCFGEKLGRTIFAESSTLRIYFYYALTERNKKWWKNQLTQ